MVVTTAVLIIGGFIALIAGAEVRRAKQYDYGNAARYGTLASLAGVLAVCLGLYMAVHTQVG